MEFHETETGKRFFESAVPALIRKIEKIGTELEIERNEAGQTIVTMFKLLAQDLEAQELCPMKTPCEPEHLEDNGCIECLINHYTKKAEEAIIHDRS